MEIVHYKELSGSKHETYFVRWGATKKHWIDFYLENLPPKELVPMARRIEKFANGELPLQIPEQFQSYESLGEPTIYAVKYPRHIHRFYCVYDEINGKDAAVFFYYLAKKRTDIPAREQENLRQRRNSYFASKTDMIITEAED